MRVEKIGDATLILGNCDEVDLLSIIDISGAYPHKSLSVCTDPPYGIPIMTEFADVKRSKAAAATGKNFKPVHGNDQEFDPTRWLIGRDQLFWGANHFAHNLPHNGRWLVWDKRCQVCPPRSQADCEMAWCSEYGAARVYYHVWDGMVKDSEMGQARVHPTQKPIALMQYCIANYCKGEVIFDPYMGSGTTGVAALKEGRGFIGIEIDPDYFEAACQRLREVHIQPDLFHEVA